MHTKFWSETPKGRDRLRGGHRYGNNKTCFMETRCESVDLISSLKLGSDREFLWRRWSEGSTRDGTIAGTEIFPAVTAKPKCSYVLPERAHRWNVDVLLTVHHNTSV
jgi:hypothetical protein